MSAGCHSVLESPIGPLVVVSADGVLAGLYMSEHLHAPSGFGERTADCLPAVREELEAYFDGDLTTFSVPVAPRGTEFQQRVWAALQEIPYAQTTSYGELAARIGAPNASRAVGLANGRNPISIVIPCHRVIGANGSLTGYGGGLERKQHLLALERGELTLL
jgi:methylated-DNA-[protein]-cysteine S-methyltransferase